MITRQGRGYVDDAWGTLPTECMCPVALSWRTEYGSTPLTYIMLFRNTDCAADLADFLSPSPSSVERESQPAIGRLSRRASSLQSACSSLGSVGLPIACSALAASGRLVAAAYVSGEVSPLALPTPRLPYQAFSIISNTKAACILTLSLAWTVVLKVQECGRLLLQRRSQLTEHRRCASGGRPALSQSSRWCSGRRASPCDCL